jgi:hypothetical protein
MSEQNTNQNEELNPRTLSQVIRASQAILDMLGNIDEDSVGGHDLNTQIAIVPIETSELTHVPEGVMPTIRISRPVGDMAKRASWSYAITYGMQDETASRNIRIMNDEIPEAKMAFYDGTTERQLTETEAQAVASDLTRLAEV